MKWIKLIFRLIPAFLFFLAAVKWYGQRPNTYIAGWLLAGAMWTYNAMHKE